MKIGTEYKVKPMTFDELFADFNITQDERKLLVYRLAALRAQKTMDALLFDLMPKAKPEPPNCNCRIIHRPDCKYAVRC